MSIHHYPGRKPSKPADTTGWATRTGLHGETIKHCKVWGGLPSKKAAQEKAKEVTKQGYMIIQIQKVSPSYYLSRRRRLLRRIKPAWEVLFK